jgi:hypothetical protein
MFGPSSMRIHPIFTRLKDWSGDDKPDGIDALIEFSDQFNDPTKASGTVIFELFEFQKFNPERRGSRVVNQWVGSLQTLREQRDHWNRTSRTYSFQLAYDVNPNQSYVLSATFNLSGGGRFYDQIVLAPPQGAYNKEPLRAPTTGPATAPASQPTTRPATPATAASTDPAATNP